MPDISQQLQDLVLAGRNASRPNQEDYDRVLGALNVQLGSVMGGSASVTTVRGLAIKAIGITLAALALVVGGGIWVISRSAQSAPDWASAVTIAAASVSTRVPPPADTAPTFDESARNTATAEPPSGQGKSATPTANGRGVARGRDSLSEEVAVLSRAETELHRGRADSALSLLNEHERRFPNGILTEERTAARVQALCALGRAAEASTQLARLSPKSLHGERARRACGLESHSAARQVSGP